MPSSSAHRSSGAASGRPRSGSCHVPTAAGYPTTRSRIESSHELAVVAQQAPLALPGKHLSPGGTDQDRWLLQLRARLPEFAQIRGGCLDDLCLREHDSGEPGDYAINIFNLATKDASDNGCRGISVAP